MNVYETRDHIHPLKIRSIFPSCGLRSRFTDHFRDLSVLHPQAAPDKSFFPLKNISI